jgi:nucleoside-diphosphate-sugar epimerase
MNKELKLAELKQPVVVTGAFGFLGKRTIDALLALGASKIVAFDLPGFQLPEEWQENVRYIQGDISNKADVKKMIEGAGTVIHLAAMVGDWIPLPLHRKVTVEGSRALFEEAVSNDTRVVLSSSIVVYGDKLTTGPSPEDKEWGKPVGPYSICKQRQEKLAFRYHEKESMWLSVVRPANVYGAGSKPWVHDAVEALKSGAPILIDGGDFNAALVHVDNVVQMLLLAATKDEALGQVFNGGDGNSATWKQYMSDLAEVLELPKPKSIPLWLIKPLSGGIENIWRILKLKKRPPLTREALNLVCAETIIPIQKAKDLLGYVPKVGYEEGFEEVKQYVEKELM